MVLVAGAGLAGALSLSACSGSAKSSSPDPERPTASGPAMSTAQEAPAGQSSCRSATDRHIALLQDEFKRLNPLPLDAARSDDGVAELSDDYYAAIGELEAEAASQGCDRPVFARSLLERATELTATGPIAAIARVAVVDEAAWRVARAAVVASPTTLGPVKGPSIAVTPESTVTSCGQIGRKWAEIVELMSTSLKDVPLDRYLSIADVRSIDVRDIALGDTPLQFTIAGLPEQAAALNDASDRLACDDADLAAVLLEQIVDLPSPSASATVFLADQVDVAALLVLGF
jgi:hypothetical protein